MRKNLSILFMILGIALLTTSCRDEEMIRKALDAYMYQAPEGAEFVGMETCGACHEEEVKRFSLSTHSRLHIEGEGVTIEGCETCHGPGSVHVDAGGGQGNIINPKQDPNACFVCHTEKKAELQLPYHHPVMEGKVSCNDCHSPHGMEARPGAMTSLESINANCAECHKTQTEPYVWRHEALEEGCTVCHKVHGSVNDKMLVARDSNLCLRCHAQSIYPTVGNSSHTTRLDDGSCFSAGCHTAVHGSNFDEHLRY